MKCRRLKCVLLKLFGIGIDSFKLFGNINRLRTCAETCSTTDATVGLTQFFNSPVVTDKISFTSLYILRVTLIKRKTVFVKTFVIMSEDSRNIYAVRTGHAVCTCSTWHNIGIGYILAQTIRKSVSSSERGSNEE